MPRQVEQDVDFVSANEFGGLFVCQGGNVAPNVDRRPKMIRDVIGFLDARIAVDREKIFVKLGEQSPTPRHDDVPLKIGGQEADANFVVRVEPARIRRDVGGIFFVVGVKGAEVLGGKVFGTVRGEERVARLGAGFDVIALQHCRKLETFD